MERSFLIKKEENIVPRAFTNMLSNVKKERFVNISGIVNITLAFFLLGVVIYVVTFFYTATRRLESQTQVTVFFEDTFVEENIFELRSQLESDDRIASINYISKSEAYRIFTDLNKDNPILLESVSEEVLPASIEIKAVDVKDLADISDEIAGIDGIEEVKFYENVVSKFIYWSHVVYNIGAVLVILCLFVAFSVTLITLRTAISAQGAELEIMRLVGASNSYVRRPFILQGVSLGLLSGIISSIFLYVLYLFISKWWGQSLSLALIFVPHTSVSAQLFVFILVGILLLLSTLLGLLGSATAIKKYLNY